MEFSRRRVIKAAGISTTVGIPTISSASTVDSVEIPVFESVDGVEKYETVPRAWNEHRKQARRVKDRIVESYLSRSGVEEVSLTRGDSQIGGKQRLKIRVEVDPNKSPPSIPAERNGIRVEVGITRESRKLACYNGDAYDPIPGGVFCQVSDMGLGTITCTVSGDTSGTKYLLTAAHLANSCDSDPVGESFYQNANGGLVGEVTDVNASKDWLVSDIQYRDWEDKIKLEGTDRLPVKGWINDKGLETYVGSATMEKIGMMTGYTSGTLNKISISGDDEGCTDWNGNGIECKCVASGGDSGAPIYFKSQEGEAYLVAILQQGQWPKFSNNCEGGTEYNRSQGYHFKDFVDSSDYTLPAT